MRMRFQPSRLHRRCVAIFRDERLPHTIERAGEHTGIAGLIEDIRLVAGARCSDAEPDAAITGEAHGPFGFELEVTPLLDGEEVAPRAAGTLAADEFALLDVPCGGAFGLPAVEGLAVEWGTPVGGGSNCGGEQHRGRASRVTGHPIRNCNYSSALVGVGSTDATESRCFQGRLARRTTREGKCLKSGLVDLDGFEPSTSSMPWKRAPNCATGPSLRQIGVPWIEKLDLGWDTLSKALQGHWSVTEYNTSGSRGASELTVWFTRCLQ